MKWWQWIICLIIIVVGAFCAVDTVKYLTASSKTFGDYKYVPSNYIEFFEEDMQSLALEDADGDGYYTYSKKIRHIDFDGTQKNYELLVNDVICYSNEVNAGAIKAVLKLDFKTVENTINGSCTVNITVAFYESGTQITIGVQDDNNALINFENYVANSGFTLKVVEVLNG